MIGTAVARRARAFDMRIVYYSRTRKPEVEADLGAEWRDDMDAVLAESDFVSLHMPLTPDTEYMIGKRELGLMQATAFLINTTRGRTVNPRDLHEALAGGAIAGAAIDVTDPEPIPFDDPLLSLDNLLGYASHRQRKPSDRAPHGANVCRQYHRRAAGRDDARVR